MVEEGKGNSEMGRGYTVIAIEPIIWSKGCADVPIIFVALSDDFQIVT